MGNYRYSEKDVARIEEWDDGPVCQFQFIPANSFYRKGTELFFKPQQPTLNGLSPIAMEQAKEIMLEEVYPIIVKKWRMKW